MSKLGCSLAGKLFDGAAVYLRKKEDSYTFDNVKVIFLIEHFKDIVSVEESQEVQYWV